MSGATGKRWLLPEWEYPEEWGRLGEELRVPPAGLAVLWNRGLRTREELDRFLTAKVSDLFPPSLLSDLAPALERLQRARRSGEKILVFGDSDVDGITATVLWTRALARLGCLVEPFVPNRFLEGFGLSMAVLERARRSGAGLLIANDCGTTAHEEAGRAREMGLDVIVVDHHVPDPELPAFTALVNPHRPGDRSSFHDLAAVGVAFKILQGLMEEVGSEELSGRLLEDLDLVALGTIADQVPLVGENRILVRLGLERLRDGPRPPLLALAERIGEDLTGITADRLARFLIPRLNACGRLGAPEHALDLLLADETGQLDRLVTQVEEDNQERRRKTERVLEEGVDRVERLERVPSLLVLADAAWHPGVLGIAASRLAERYRVPVLLISLANQLARGSGRSLPGVDMLRIMESARPCLVSCGGHPRAVGVALDPARLPELLACLAEVARSLPPADAGEVLRLDGMLDPFSCDLALSRWLEKLSPFGPGNEEPLFWGSGLCHRVRVEGQRHLRFSLGSGARTLDCIGFGLGARAAEIPRSGACLDLAYLPTVNFYQQRERLQLKLSEFRFGEVSHA